MVLFPGVVIPITGRDKSIKLINDANAAGKNHRRCGSKDESDEDTKDDIHTIGTVARILRVLKCLMEYPARKNVLKLNRLLLKIRI
jgi:ATP-dependent Lon protease